MQKIVYFAHDLTDPAVHRRVKMFEWAGANVTLIGFRRGVRPVETVAGIAAIDLGQTGDGQLARRVASVAAVWARLDRLAGALQGAKAILARNLEMLFLAVSARLRVPRHSPNAQFASHRRRGAAIFGSAALAPRRSTPYEFARFRASLFSAARLLRPHPVRRKQSVAEGCRICPVAQSQAAGAAVADRLVRHDPLPQESRNIAFLDAGGEWGDRSRHSRAAVDGDIA
jgi:hypothetical protein